MSKASDGGAQTNTNGYLKGYLFPRVGSSQNAVQGSDSIEEDNSFKRLAYSGHASGDHFYNNLNAHSAFNDSGDSVETDEVKKAYGEGLAEGQRMGARAQEEKNNSVFRQFSHMCSELDTIKSKVIEDAQSQVIKLSLAIAKKIIAHEAHINDDVIKNTVNQAMHSISDSNLLKIRVNPSDLKALKTNGSGFEGNDKIDFVPDSSISRGGCLVETSAGDVDARIEKQLQVVKNALISAD